MSTDAEAIARDLNRATSLVIEQMHEAGMPICMREGETTWRTYHAGFDLSLFAQRITDACCDAILSYLASRREAVANDDIANALEKCDWSGASIGNKAIISAAIERLRENVLFCQDATDHLALIDYIADKIGLPKNEELSRENFATWLAASRREAEPEYIYDDARFNRGVQHVVDMLARNLGVTDWVAGDGSEDYDDDLWQTVLNILSAKSLYDADSGEFASRREAQEPVAWRYRWKIDGEWVSWRVSERSQASEHLLPSLEEYPLYLAPPAPAGEVERPSGFIKPDNDRQVFFYEQDFYVLSNFSAFELKWKGLRFATSEAAYHYEKFPDDEMARMAVLHAPSAHEAFKAAENMRSLRRMDWDDVKVDVMRDILRAKAAQHEYVRRKLLATGDRELIEDSWRDDFWGWGPNRDGNNMLGKLWMEVRAELRAALNGGRE